MRYELPGEVSALEVSVRATSGDTVVLRDWEPESRVERNIVLKRLHNAGVTMLNGAGYFYSLGFPKPWEHDGAVPGSALKEGER